MIKNLIKKNIRFYSKLALLIGAFIVFICSFGVSTFAFTENDDGNLVSDNLFSIGSYSNTLNGVSVSVSNQTLTLNGTSSGGFWDNRSDLSITLDVGTYTMQWFTNYTENNIGFGIFNSDNSDLANLYILNTERYRTFTINERTTFYTMIWWSSSVISFNNVKVSCMVYKGSYNAYTLFEPYGVTYYSQSNYNQAYNQAYNQGVNSVFDGLRNFNAIQGYYASSILFRSTDNGNTFNNLNSLGIAVQNVYNGNLKVSLSAQSWAYGDNIIYYIDIQFTSPIYIANLYLPSLQRPNPQYVSVNDINFDFSYTMVDGVGYFVTRNIYKITDNLRFYFKAYDGMPLSFDIIVKGFNNAIDTYETGFNDGVSSLQTTIDGLNENIQVLKTQNATLKTQLEHGNSSWTSLFFAMADTPFKTASNFLGFEIFGVNLFNALIGFITILAIFWVFKRLIK